MATDMAEPFKNWINADTVRWLGKQLAAAQPGFPRAKFEKLASTGLEALALKPRARHIADALEATLPAEPKQAFSALTRALDGTGGGSSFRFLAFSEYLERHGPRDVKAALAANYELTQRFTAEFSVRSLIAEAWPDVERAFSKWVRDDNEHVRRWVSEGSRPRLPWGRRLDGFVKDPSPILPLLEALKDDPSEYVRRSVANNLNDIAEDHPDVVLRVARQWLVGASKERRKLVEHSLRTLLKRGDARALALLGAGDAKALEVSASLSPAKVRLGEYVTFSATVKNEGKAKAHVVLEACVHFVKVRGTSVKPFRLARVDLEPGEAVALSRRMKLEHRSIRRLHAGKHLVELQVNGTRRPMGAFSLSL